MSKWSIADAKARFSELVLQVREGPQHVTKRGHEVAIVIAPADYERLKRSAEQGDDLHPMRAFLKATDTLRGGEDLGLTLPPRKRRKARPDPFGTDR